MKTSKIIKVPDIKNITVVYNETPEIQRFRESLAKTYSLDEDWRMKDIITSDISKIYNDLGGQDGMIDKRPFTIVVRGCGFIRLYSFLRGGGFGIFSEEKDEEAFRQVFTLGEDDGWYFLNCGRIWENVLCSKSEFTYGISELLSLWNNIEI